MGSREITMQDKKTSVTLRTVAGRVGLAACTVSAVLNKTAAALAIPERTQNRIFRAAAELNYRPNLSARSLRTRRSNMVAVIGADFGQARMARVVSGMERTLRRRGYLLVVGTFGSNAESRSLSAELQQRGIDGVMAIGTSLPRELELPVVSVHLGDVAMQEPFTDDVCSWLTELGESAADAVLWKIETKDAPRLSRIVPKLPIPYFDLPGTSLGVPQASAAFD
jgi:hypothetical protein